MAEPAGTPISQALVVRRLEPDPRALTERVVRALSAVDRVHGDGDLPSIPVDWAVLEPGVAAVYELVRFGQANDVPRRIVVSTTVRRPGLAVLYEIGHFLDHQTLGERGRFASLGHPGLAAWRRAIYATRAIAELRRLRDSGRYAALYEHFDYLLRPDEAWERSYAQYIVQRGGDPALLAELDERRRPTGSPFIPYLWDDDDIVLVAAAIDELFRELGWRR